MGMGVMLGAILVVVLGIGVLWFVMSGRMSASGTNTPIANNSTNTITAPDTKTTPDIKLPDTITINPPAITVNPPATAPAP